ncbi:MAG: hypothetical protein EP343_15235 [Deltaproteobacteria bacterium]|nr:MAG: hypothetical protein EP343_15235 [Deltaproteobacteria bacterium]
MSEFSDSYHLRTNDPLEAVRLIHTLGCAGVVLPLVGEWVTFLVEGPTSGPMAELVEANTGRLLHYTHAEDHGTWLRFFSGNNEVTEASCSWETPNEREMMLQERQALEEMREAGYPIDEETFLPSEGSLPRKLDLGFSSQTLVEEGFCDRDTAALLQDLCDRPRFPSRENRYPIAQALGLAHHKWLSCNDVIHLSWNDWREAYPGIILMDRVPVS